MPLTFVSSSAPHQATTATLSLSSRSDRPAGARRGAWVLVATAALLLSACGDKKAPSAAPAAPPVGVLTLVAQSQGLHTELTGRTKASQSAEVRPQVSGILQKRLFTEGSTVKAGQPLYQIDARTLEAAAKSAEAALTKARASAQTARTNAERNAELVKIDAISRQVFDESQAQVAQSAADVAVAQAALDNARINLQFSRIVAPIGGQTDLSVVLPGSLVTANQAQALTTISQLDPIHVDITQSSAELLALRRQWQAGVFGKVDASGAPVRLMLEDGSAYPHVGKLQFTGATVGQNTGAITLRAVFPNPDQLLMPGMYVRAQLATGVSSDAIVVPQQAVQRDPAGKPSVQLVNADNKIEKRPIQLGQALGAQWLVLGGLKAGDRVMVDGFQKARVGQAVTPVAMRVEGSRVVEAQASAPAGQAASAPPKP
ncbi:MAG: efflux RND transporter periplasmic adaptor subunit [Gammaproteobacteria bacterium]|nr:efflux RND transporter periplasmic adaptor subunit [Gammaproteobacteria bacterium]MBU0891263.1 efflux RND transporter periplasmic adaptor subunit [Gammaproteobacteria bacterium]MBU1352489.1 efflux RND transporter periplasmic adaptor subunit [Gammaproteobacteria bacterium]MBU1505287.1 efflux RND transporter periplasmic adaptor subunit [Gammaproteobacteria bacterium]MBU2122790.1 efflux RND transporter periplasmic adaptor subunit [Gammaproteobacteria bacterium]